MPMRLCDELRELHEELERALQVVLTTKSFVPGTYQKRQYADRWRLVDGSN